MQMTIRIVVCLFLCILQAKTSDASCDPAFERRGCFKDQGFVNGILYYRGDRTNFTKSLPKATCRCAEEVKLSNQDQKYTGFALQIERSGYWNCKGTPKDHLNDLGKGSTCKSTNIEDPCDKADELCIGLESDGEVFAFEFKTKINLPVCHRNYTKVGCYEQGSPRVGDLLIFDRFNIKWNHIEEYMHSLACKCRDAAMAANKEAGTEKYAGFALHFYGECYGRTRSDLDEYNAQQQSERCTGDGNFNGCRAEHNECVGHAYSEFVYRL